MAKVESVVVNDVPEDMVSEVLACINESFKSYETGKTGEEKQHEFSFAVAGTGAYRRITHTGALARPLREQIESFAKGVMAFAAMTKLD